VVGLGFGDGVADEVDVRFDCRGDVREGAVGAGDQEEVGEVGDCAPEVGGWARVPVVLEGEEGG
jgi:hypothetical protein